MHICTHCNGTKKCDCEICGVTKYLKNGLPYKGSGICLVCFDRDSEYNDSGSLNSKKNKVILTQSFFKKLGNNDKFIIFSSIIILIGIFVPLIILGINKKFNSPIPIENTTLYIVLGFAGLVGFIVYVIRDNDNDKSDLVRKKINEEKEVIEFMIKGTKGLYKAGKFSCDKIYKGSQRNGRIEFKDDSNQVLRIDIENVDIISRNTVDTGTVNDILDIFNN